MGTSREGDKWWETNSTDREKAIARKLAGCLLSDHDISVLDPVGVDLYVTTTPEIVRARGVLDECSRRLSLWITPLCVLADIAPVIDRLECWLGVRAPHFERRQR